MKKLLSLFLALALVASLGACTNKKGNDEENGGEQGGGQVVVPPDDSNTDMPDGEDTNNGSNGSTDQPDGGSSSKPNGGGSSKPDTGGGSKPSAGGSSSANKGDLLTLMGALLKGTEDEMTVVTEEIPSDAYKANLFIDYIEGSKAVSSAPMIGSIAHSVCLLQLPDGADVAKIADTINQNKDPRKWICVEAEKSAVLHSGNYILLVMSTSDLVDTITKNFKANF
jgi:hypothetical protein